MGKKTAAQIRRMQKRALERGETYEAPPPPAPAPAPEASKESTTSGISSKDEIQYEAAQKLQSSLLELETNAQNLNSKEKRSAKRKAEAVALEESGMEANDLLSWFDQHQHKFQNSNDNDDDNRVECPLSREQQKKFKAARKYLAAQKEIEQNKDYKAKDRRSAKKRAAAIALEETLFEDIDQLIEFYNEHRDVMDQVSLQRQQQQNKKKRKAKELDGEHGAPSSSSLSSSSKKKNPYILFVGQIPFDTTSDQLFQHFQKYMGPKIITRESMTIRIPQDETQTKTNHNDNDNDNGSKSNHKSKSKGFAFCQFSDPEIMYECLKMHHTPLNGRRINVLRSAGGGKASRIQTHKQRRIEQDEYISSTVDKILQDYTQKGHLKEGELDQGAILLCKRRSAAMVEAALVKYIEQRGEKQLDNPSAFFTNVMCQVTDEGVAAAAAGGGGRAGGAASDGTSRRNKHDHKKRGGGGSKGSRSRDASVFTKSGVDMSISDPDHGDGTLSKIFPSMGRGRGRGRGAYMR